MFVRVTGPSRKRFHVGIIMDGNGRWAEREGQPRSAGHRAGADSVRNVVRTAPDLGIDILTLYAFSSDNWLRPAREVRVLMGLFQSYLIRETSELIKEGVQLTVIGRRDRLPRSLREAIDVCEARTAGGDKLHLRVAIDYSARWMIADAARRWARESWERGGNAVHAVPDGLSGPTDIEESRAMIDAFGSLISSDPNAAHVDLVIRTGGEQRVSDFLLWEIAYAELYFTPLMWPDAGADELAEAVEEFAHRDRRFGRVPMAERDEPGRSDVEVPAVATARA